MSRQGLPGGSVVKNLAAMQELQEMGLSSLGQEDPLEKEVVTLSSILAWEILWTEEPGRPQSMGLQRAGQGWGYLAGKVLWHMAASRMWEKLLSKLNGRKGCTFFTVFHFNPGRNWRPRGLRVMWQQDRSWGPQWARNISVVLNHWNLGFSRLQWLTLINTLIRNSTLFYHDTSLMWTIPSDCDSHLLLQGTLPHLYD